MHELGLVLFSLILQSAIGFSVMLYLYRKPVLAEAQDKSLTWMMFGIAVTAGVGLLIAMTHMGYPMNAPFALTNYGSSWLSREVILAPVFIGLIGMLFLLGWFKKAFNSKLLLLAAVVGASDVFCLANIYKSSSVITWSTNHSLAIHIGGMFLLGALTMTFFLSRQNKEHSLAIKQLLLVMLAVVVVRMVTQIDLINNLDARAAAQGIMFPWNSVDAFNATLPMLQAAWGFGFLGAVLIVIQLLKPASTSKPGLSPMLLVTLGAVTLYEVLCRGHFYIFHT